MLTGGYGQTTNYRPTYTLHTHYAHYTHYTHYRQQTDTQAKS